MERIVQIIRNRYGEVCAIVYPHYDKWIALIPGAYRENVLNKDSEKKISIERDPNNLSLLKHYGSLIPLAQEARKPIFHLTSADGALGAHLNAVKNAYQDFKNLAIEIAKRTGIQIPSE